MKAHLLQALAAGLAILAGSGNIGAASGKNHGTAQKTPLPEDFPAFSRQLGLVGDLSIGQRVSDFTQLSAANADLLNSLPNYTAESISRVFGERMKKERDIHMKLLIAAEAATNGNPEARKFIQKLAETTDYFVTLSRLSALGYLVTAPDPQEWVFDEIYKALRDTRKVTGSEFNSELDISDVADEIEYLTYALANIKNPRSVPVLIEMAKRTEGRAGPVAALGGLGDPRAIPVCLEFLQREDKAIKQGTTNETALSKELLSSLAELKATAAVPILLNYLQSPEVIDALGKIGDERAIGPLQDIAADRGGIEGIPDPANAQRRFVARMALVRLGKEDPVAKWTEMLGDPSLDAEQRSQLIGELEERSDPRAIPALLRLVISDPDGSVVDDAIEALSSYRRKAAVAGLIECFDADFAGKSDPNGLARSDRQRTDSPFMFKENIADALHRVTGKDFGPEKARWQKWWKVEEKNWQPLK